MAMICGTNMEISMNVSSVHFRLIIIVLSCMVFLYGCGGGNSIDYGLIHPVPKPIPIPPDNR